MPTYEQAIEALRRADAAGNVEDARRLAVIANDLRSGQEQPQREVASGNAGGGSVAKDVVRAAEFGTRGFTDRAMEVAGAPFDAVAWGMRKVGLPAREPGYYGDAFKEAAQEVGRFVSKPVNAAVDALGVDLGPQEPQNAVERGSYAAGQGVADAASVMLPAAAVGKLTKAGGLASSTGKALAASPALQATGSAAASVVGDATDNPWLGLATALAIPGVASVGRRAVSPVANQLSPRESVAAAKAAKMGIKLTPGQMTGSRPLQNAESGLAQLPLSSRPQQAIYDAQRATLNRSVLSKAGVDADSLTPDLLDDAYVRLGKTFDDLADQTTVILDDVFAQNVDDAAREYGRRLPTDVKPVFQSYVDDLLAARKIGQVDGREFQNIASGIKRAARRAKTNPDLQNALNGLTDSVDDAMVRSAPADVAEEWAKTNRLYRNLLIVDDAATRGAMGDRVAGDIPVTGLRAAVKNSDPRGFARGRGEFADDVQVGEFLANTIPNSGTAERSNMIGMLTGATPTGTGMGAMMVGAEPVTAITAGASTFALPPIAQAAINSAPGRAYLTNQLMQGGRPLSPLAAQLAASRGTDRALSRPR